MSNNYIDLHIDEIHWEFKLLGHWTCLNAADQMIPGNYWLTAVREFYNFVEYDRMEDIPTADIATHPFLLAAWNESIARGARFINAEIDEVTNTYRPAITSGSAARKARGYFISSARSWIRSTPVSEIISGRIFLV